MHSLTGNSKSLDVVLSVTETDSLVFELDHNRLNVIISEMHVFSLSLGCFLQLMGFKKKKPV